VLEKIKDNFNFALLSFLMSQLPGYAALLNTKNSVRLYVYYSFMTVNLNVPSNRVTFGPRLTLFS